MSVYAADILFIAIGLALAAPWCIWLRHVQRVLHGEAAPSRFLAVGKAGTVLETVYLGLAGLGLIFCSLHIMSLLVKLGIFQSGRTQDFASVFAGLAVSGGLIFVQWKFYERRFLARINLQLRTCYNCGYALKGLRLCNGAIRCPECGKSESAREIVARYRLEKKQASTIRREARIEDDSSEESPD